MSNTLDEQILYLKLDAISGGIVADLSGSGLNASVTGDTQVVADSFFGSAVSFDGAGDYARCGNSTDALDQLSTAFTLTAWINPDKLANTASSRMITNVFFARTSASGKTDIECGIGSNGKLLLYLLLNNRPEYFEIGGIFYTTGEPYQELGPGSWHFVAVVFDNGTITAYLDDRSYTDKAASNSLSAGDSHVTVGGGADENAGFVGSMQGVRVFDSALSSDEISAIKRVDLTAATTPSRQSVLLDFAIEDHRGQPALHIVESGRDEPASITIENTASRTLLIPALDEDTALTADTAPLWIQFRAGVLDDDCYSDGSDGEETGLSISAEDWNWNLARQSDGSGLLLLAPQHDMEFAAGATLSFILNGLSAASEGGARSTRAMLGFQHIAFPSTDGNTSTATVSGYRQIFLHIINQSGRRTTPLILAFVGSNAIINDGENENSFTLSLVNPTSSPISLATSSSDAPTRLTFMFPTGDDLDDVAVLCTSDQALVTDLHAEDGTWNIEQSTQGLRIEWIVANVDVATIPANGHIEFTFSGLKTNAASGKTLVTMRYENLPGYWDGYLGSPIDKAPLRYLGSNVGIGTANPQHTLDVNGTLRTRGSANIEGKLSAMADLAVGGALDVAGRIVANKSVDVAGAVSAANLSVAGAVSAAGLAVSGAASAASLDIAGAACAASLSITGAMGDQALADTGYQRLGNLLLQWGIEKSTGDHTETFYFKRTFKNCFFVNVCRVAGDSYRALLPVNWTESSFTVNRKDDIDGTNTFSYFAIGEWNNDG